MSNFWKNLNDLIEYSQGGILSKELLKTDKLNITLFCLAAGTAISEHTSTKEGGVMVLEGKGVFNLRGEEVKMGPGVFIYLEKDAVHSLKAEANTSFLLMLYQVALNHPL